MSHILIMLSAALLLSACDNRQCIIFCHNQTSIQADYVVARDECQSTAQSIVGGLGSADKERNAALLEVFAKCMKQQGWGVTSPKKTKARPGGPNDNSTLAGDPWAPTPYGIQQPPRAAQTARAPGAMPPQAYQHQQGYGYPQQSYTPAYNPYPQQAAPAQNYGYAPMQQNYGYAAPPAPSQSYGYSAMPPVQDYGYGYEGGIGESEYGPTNSNRAGIGLAPGF